jgi:1-acyl-sn-glycerol-3-phosphate acyltransferase
VVVAGTMILMLPRRTIASVAVRWVDTIFAGLKLISGIDVAYRGFDRLPSPPFILASKHQSAWDTLVYLRLFPDCAYVLKSELFLIPFYGWAARRLGHIAVNRLGRTKALRLLLRRAERIAAQGRVLVIFPEGARMAPGTRGPYLPGVAALYGRLGLPVVPVGLNSGLFWPRRRFLRRPGCIVVEAGDPILPGLPRDDFMARLEKEVEAITARLEVEARGEVSSSTREKAG